MAAHAAVEPASLATPPAWLVEECRVLEPPPADERRHVLREEAALLLDRLLVRVARGHGAIDVAIGETLAALSVGDRILRLGYSSVGDYARERVGIAPRTAQARIRLARGLRERPLLRSAVLGGEITTRKAESILPRAAGSHEAAWLERARSETVRALEVAARAEAAATNGEDDDEPWDRIEAVLPPDGRAVVDRALALAGDLLGANSPRWRRIEALCEEYLGAHPVEPREDDHAIDPVARFEAAAIQEALEVEMDCWRWLDALHASGPAERGPGGPVAAPVPDTADEPHPDVVQLDADLRRLAGMRAGWDAELGRLAMLVQWCGLWRDMGFASFGHYCSERLGMSGRAVTQRTRLERRMYALPRLREAFRSGRISYEKARLVAEVSDEGTVEMWIAQAERSTCVALGRLVDCAEETQMCARREVAWRVPARVGALVRAAFRAAREAEGRWLTPGECVVRLAEHFVATWEGAIPERRTRAAKVIRRDLGFCQVPGCSRAAVHAHHLQFRSAGGSDDPSNLVAVCAGHHHQGVHAGWVRVSGTAPGALRWELGCGLGGPPLEVFEPAA